VATILVFSNNLNASVPNLSTRFTNAVGFYIDIVSTSFELEIDCYLQVYLPTSNGEKARVLPLGKIEEQSLFVNQIDTENLAVIPEEFLDTGLEMALLFVPSQSISTYLEVFIVQKDLTLENLSKQIEELKNLLSTPIPINLDSYDFMTLYNLGFI
jgi:hypothetical protein